MKEAKNNSYETEPSSSSSSVGSKQSLGGVNSEYIEMVDVEHINLAHLLEPRIFEFTEEVCNEEVTFVSEEKVAISCKNVSISSANYRSSQESPFSGFRETPLKQLEQKFVYDDTTANDTDDDVIFVQTFPLQHPTATVAKTAIYDIIVNENSCNAVDMPIISEEVQPVADLQAITTDLSFNGKIKALDLNCSTEDQKDEGEHDEKPPNLNDSSFLKYSRSPDLFADDEDNDNNDEVREDVDNNDSLPIKLEKESGTCKHDEQNKKQVPTPTNVKDEQMDTSANRSLNCPTESSFADESNFDYLSSTNEQNSNRLFRENCKRERELLRRIKKCLSGVLPPPSMTIPQIDLIHMVLDRKADILSFFNNIEMPNNEKANEIRRQQSLFKPTHSLADAINVPWRDVLGVRQHGFSYNLTSASEQCEYLSLSVVDRFIGAETNSSYSRSPSSAKKRSLRIKLLTQSPGNRLSHLAKRRAIFSSANLATTSRRSANALGPQIVVDKKKTKSRRKATPKRKTPGSKKKTRKTPSSSARKLQYRLEHNKPAPTRETSKRALFQSPMELQQQQQLNLIKPQIKPEIATKVEKSKRALFSPELQKEMTTTSFASQQLLQTSSFLKRKRSENKVDEDDDESFEGLYMPSKKFSRCDASNLTPRALKIKSQSFCIGAGSSTAAVTATAASSTTLKNAKRNLLVAGHSSNSLQSLSSVGSNGSLNMATHGAKNLNSTRTDNKLQRAQSEIVGSSASLTENQKKKLLWAVSQALQEKKITTKHENFKQFATVLARVVRRIFQEFYQRISTSNSETLLRLAKKYVFYVISGRSCDDIYKQVRAEESKRLSMSRLTGYIGPEEYQQRNKQQQQLSQLSQTSSMISNCSMSFCGGSMQNLLSIDDTSSQPSSQPSVNHNKIASIESNVKQSQQMSFNNLWPSKSVNDKQQRSNEMNTSLQNSSSKSNFGSIALRENSGQKNFTGRDQRNMSPYAKTNSGLKIATAAVNSADCTKAKRQIFFDS